MFYSKCPKCVACSKIWSFFKILDLIVFFPVKAIKFLLFIDILKL